VNKPNIIAVVYNFHHHPEHGMSYEFIRIGEDATSFIPGATTRTCIEIKHVKTKDEDYVEVIFNDDTLDRIYNYTKIILAYEPAYTRLLPNIFDQSDQEINK